MSIRIAFTRALLVGPLVLCTPHARAAAQAPGSRAPTPVTATGPSWRLVMRARLESDFDDNVFLLSPPKAADFAAPSAGDLASGRFTDMIESSDVVTMVGAGLGVAGPGLTGRTLEVLPEIAYEWYARNGARRHVTVGLRVEQALPRGSRLRLRGSVTPSYFPKTYLADALDTGADGSISAAERIYRPATYGEARVAIDYRFRLAKSTKRHPFGAAVQLGGGYERRVYEAPFAVRNLRGPELGLALLFELTRGLDLDVEYEFASYAATPGPQVLVLDEDDVGRDLNGNGTITDRNIRMVEQIDVSRVENHLGAAVTVTLTKKTRLSVAYERRWRHYGSDQPLDVAYNGRRDARHLVGAELALRLAGDLALVLGGDLTDQGLNRPTDLGGIGDIDDYRRHRAFLSLRFGS